MEFDSLILDSIEEKAQVATLDTKRQNEHYYCTNYWRQRNKQSIMNLSDHLQWFRDPQVPRNEHIGNLLRKQLPIKAADFHV